MKKIEVLRSKGYSITVDEEHFKAKLESLQRELNMPNLYKGKLNELSSFVRMLDERPQVQFSFHYHLLTCFRWSITFLWTMTLWSQYTM
jgi:hypothetical protein